MANVSSSPSNNKIIRVACINCGHSKEWECSLPGVCMWANRSSLFTKGVIVIGDSVDWYFHLHLWLKAPCCRNEVWAYNYEHLEWLEKYIGADLRERKENNTWGWSNQSLASRLPKWLKSSKNRIKIIETINKLKSK